MSLKLKRVELHKLCLLSECQTSLHIDLNKVKEINKCYEVVSENNSWEEQSKSEILRLGSSWLSYIQLWIQQSETIWDLLVPVLKNTMHSCWKKKTSDTEEVDEVDQESDVEPVAQLQGVTEP